VGPPGGGEAAVRGGGLGRTPLALLTVIGVLVIALVALALTAGDDDGGPEETANTRTTPTTGGSATTAGPATTASSPPSSSTTTSTSTTTTTAPTTTTTAPVTDLAISGVSAPATAADGNDACGNPTTFAASNLTDGVTETAWRMDGDGTGQSLTIDLGGEYHVDSVAMVPGYAKVDPCDQTDRFPQNGRPAGVTWIFDDGTEVPQSLGDSPEAQSVGVDATTSTIVLRIDGVTPGERDYTAISELAVRGSAAA
jgi:hypothetical protein